MGKRKKTAGPSQNFVVEKILDSYLDEIGNRWYFLKWLGYPSEQATWEPESNVDCTGLVKEYENNKAVASPPIQWSLKQDSGSSTKIVLKKISSVLSAPLYCDQEQEEVSAPLYQEDVVPETKGEEPLQQRHSKRRRSSTIGVEVMDSKRKKALRAKKVSSEVPALRAKKVSSEVPVEEEYMVQHILDKCLDANGRLLYLIKWIGYDSKFNTWEPVENLNCNDMLYDFNLHHRTPKLTVTKVLDKRKVEEGRTEYFVKVNGCRKEKWMFEEDLHCSDILDLFNRDYNNKIKLSLADIADDYVSDEEPRCVMGKGIKMNKECTTSSDEDTLSPIVQKNKLLLNGKSKRSQRQSSSSSDVDFEDLLRGCSKFENTESPPPSPPEAAASLTSPIIKPSDVKSEQAEPPVESPGKNSLESKVTVKSPKVTAKSPKVTAKSPKVTVKSPEVTVKSPEVTVKSPKVTVKSPKVTAKSPTIDSTDSEYEDDPLGNIRLAKFSLPQLIIPKAEPRRAPAKYTRKPSISPPPVFNYPASVTSDRGRDYSSIIQSREGPLKTHNNTVATPVVTMTTREITNSPITEGPTQPSLPDHIEPVSETEAADVSSLQIASEDSDSDESLAELENNLTKALESEVLESEPTEPDINSKQDVKREDVFSGVDLGSLIFNDSEKPLDCSANHSGLLDSLVSQAVNNVGFNSLQSAFLDSSVSERDASHSELFAVVAGHTDPPQTEKEIDLVLGALYETSVTKDLKQPDAKSERYFDEPYDDSSDDAVEPLDAPLNNICNIDLDNATSSSTPQPTSPPFKELKGILRTFGAPDKKPKKSAKRVVKKEVVKKEVPSSQKSKNLFEDTFHDDIFADITKKKKLTSGKTFSSVNNYPCSFCSRKFRDKTKLDFHISFKHPQMLEMACDACCQYFQSAIEYQCHQLTCGDNVS